MCLRFYLTFSSLTLHIPFVWFPDDTLVHWITWSLTNSDKNILRLIFTRHCTLIRGVIVIHPGLKYGLFHYTMVHFDHILSGIQISTIADFISMHSGDFCPLLQISSFAWLFLCYHGSIWNILVSWKILQLLLYFAR